MEGGMPERDKGCSWTSEFRPTNQIDLNPLRNMHVLKIVLCDAELDLLNSSLQNGFRRCIQFMQPREAYVGDEIMFMHDGKRVGRAIVCEVDRCKYGRGPKPSSRKVKSVCWTPESFEDMRPATLELE